jgi:hypothetical protein
MSRRRIQIVGSKWHLLRRTVSTNASTVSQRGAGHAAICVLVISRSCSEALEIRGGTGPLPPDTRASSGRAGPAEGVASVLAGVPSQLTGSPTSPLCDAYLRYEVSDIVAFERATWLSARRGPPDDSRPAATAVASALG